MEKFWEELPLSELNQEQWEALCDGCGLCCLVKLQDEDTDEIVYTRVVCQYSHPETGACTEYHQRSVKVPSCVPLTLDNISQFDWLPESCAYRLRWRGQPLPEWHPLNTGRADSVKKAGVGLQAIPVVVETPELDPEDYVMDKPVP